MELVAELRKPEEIAAAYGYTPEKLAEKLKTPPFRALVKECRELWSSDSNLKERIKVKAGLLVEDSLLDIFQIVADQTVNPLARNSAFTSLAKQAGTDNAEAGGGDGFKLTINLPGSSEPTVVETREEKTIEHLD